MGPASQGFRFIIGVNVRHDSGAIEVYVAQDVLLEGICVVGPSLVPLCVHLHNRLVTAKRSLPTRTPAAVFRSNFRLRDMWLVKLWTILS